MRSARAARALPGAQSAVADARRTALSSAALWRPHARGRESDQGTRLRPRCRARPCSAPTGRAWARRPRLSTHAACAARARHRPASAASPSWKTSNRALSATLASTSSVVTFSSRTIRRSFSSSWFAASRLPSVRSARTLERLIGQRESLSLAQRARSQAMRRSGCDRPRLHPGAVRFEGAHPRRALRVAIETRRQNQQQAIGILGFEQRR